MALKKPCLAVYFKHIETFASINFDDPFINLTTSLISVHKLVFKIIIPHASQLFPNSCVVD